MVEVMAEHLDLVLAVRVIMVVLGEVALHIMAAVAVVVQGK